MRGPPWDVACALPDGLAIGDTPYGLGVFATRPYRRGEILYKATCLAIPDEDGPVRLQAHVCLGEGAFDGVRLASDVRAPEECACPVYDMRVRVHSVLGEDGLRYLFGFDGFMNHSCRPTSLSIGQDSPYYTAAARDIAAGDEVTCDYNSFEVDARDKGIDECACGEAGCVGRVWGVAHLPLEQRLRRLWELLPWQREAFLEQHPTVSHVSLSAREEPLPPPPPGATRAIVSFPDPFWLEALPEAIVQEEAIGLAGVPHLSQPLYHVAGALPEGCRIGATSYGRGVFATRAYRRGDVICKSASMQVPDEPGLIRLTLHTCAPVPAWVVDASLFGSDGCDCLVLDNLDVLSHAVVGEDGLREVYGFDTCMNHSCRPSCLALGFIPVCGQRHGVAADARTGTAYYLLADRDIEEGEEITCDYNSFDWDATDAPVRCLCGEDDCLGVVQGFSQMTPQQQLERLGRADRFVRREYLSRHALPEGARLEPDAFWLAALPAEIGPIAEEAPQVLVQ